MSSFYINISYMTNIIIGPIIGSITYNTVKILLEMDNDAKNLELNIWNRKTNKKIIKKISLKKNIPECILIDGLEHNTLYELELLNSIIGSFQTFDKKQKNISVYSTFQQKVNLSPNDILIHFINREDILLFSNNIKEYFIQYSKKNSLNLCQNIFILEGKINSEYDDEIQTLFNAYFGNITDIKYSYNRHGIYICNIKKKDNNALINLMRDFFTFMENIDSVLFISSEPLIHIPLSKQNIDSVKQWSLENIHNYNIYSCIDKWLQLMKSKKVIIQTPNNNSVNGSLNVLNKKTNNSITFLMLGKYMFPSNEQKDENIIIDYNKLKINYISRLYNGITIIHFRDNSSMIIEHRSIIKESLKDLNNYESVNAVLTEEFKLQKLSKKESDKLLSDERDSDNEYNDAGITEVIGIVMKNMNYEDK